MVRCKMNRCPYFDDKSICLNPVLAIDENGMCDIFWYKGNFRPKYDKPRDQYMNKKKEQPPLIQVTFEEKENENVNS